MLWKKAHFQDLTLIAAAGLIAIAPFGAAAQTQATLSGTVVDPSSASIPQVTVSLTNSDGSSKREVKTDPDGRFAFEPLAGGAYKLEVLFPGFRLFSELVTLSGRDVDRTIPLVIGGVVETITVSTERAAAPAATTGQPDVQVAPHQPEPCSPPSTGGNIRPPKKLTDVRSLYPPQLAGTGTTGSVMIEGTIGIDGSVHDLLVLKSAHPALDQSALDAVRQWRFDPTLLNCVPIEVGMTVVMNFEEGR